MSRIKIVLGFFVVFIALSLWGCNFGLTGDDSDDGSWDASDGTTTSQNFQAAVDNIAKDQPLFEDIAEIPIPSELLALDIPEVKEIVAAMQEFNKFKTFSQTDIPAFLSLDTAKRPSTAKSDDMTVECFGDMGCTYSWKENNGQLTVSMTQLNTPDMWAYNIVLDGFGGIHHYDNFLSTAYTVKRDLSFSAMLLFQNPDSPDRPPGLLTSFSTERKKALDMPVFDSSGLPIPTTTYIYTHTTYIWDSLAETYRPNLMSIITMFPDGTTKHEQYFWSFGKDGLYLFSKGMVDDDCRSGQTIYYDDEGNITKVDDWET